MNAKLQLPMLTDLKPRITVIGVGGAGGNAVNNMIASGLTGVQFVVANTDAQALAASSAEHRLQLGVNLTEGLGAGSRPEIGEAAAEEAIEDIRKQVSGSHMVFIAAGMGGGTGTGAAGVIARVAKELGILTIGVVTKPFHFEGSRRMRVAEVGVAELRKYVDTLIVIPNQNLFRIANEKTTFAEAFVLADQVLYSGIACIVDLVIKDGLINLDLADVRTVLTGMGTSMMGTGEATGERRALVAAEEAIANPLLDNVSLKGARGLLLSITGGRDLTLFEVDEAACRVRQEVDAEANIIVGATFDDNLANRIRVSIVASGMEHGRDLHAGARLGGPFQAVASGAQRAAKGRFRWPSGPQPPRLPPLPRNDRGPANSADELTRALSEAIDSAAVTEGGPGAATNQRWYAANGAVFEEGPPELARASMPAPQLPKSEQSSRPRAFQPAPPADVRRAQRRIPEIDDFPAVGQREYRARMGAGPEPEAGAPRKLGFFERLTGVRRRYADSAAAQEGIPQADATPDANHQRGRIAGRAGASSGTDNPDGGVELPAFFNQERKE
jgi:cell division protein FtsZ